ncbi:origin recognition complex subunit 4 [Coemansia sp. RSA 1813]|nr:origin recognition complex subunit 4 [Coemansia sp. RSA 1646]KAJ1770629.1 origin recognition complex subunit 4 [Coemansia sp. RSA 1843]KAJ2093443.1 origin recognition complex subunit 4 [Coemansia sp. RSA 986]KAJ2217251.1 origin recognition complex subunit 4 [Coemansia sp. RSA 487]KAJ2572451.1 origin recognition complex subunit 4 [Coemansia sp. RSA 1813]
MPARNSAALPNAKDIASTVTKTKHQLLGRLCGHIPLPELVGLASPLEAVFSLLDRTVSSNEGNSALLIGPRGAGKSSIVRKALDALAEKHSDTRGAGMTKYHVVRLSGFIHTNDKIALRDIARQLLIEQDLENILIGSFSDAFSYILNLMRSTGTEDEAQRPPVLFILEEFDLLAQHPKQSLLYTLFDIAQSQQTPIAVLGVTARIDVMDLLEKRVKSRFSHRQIHIHYAQSLPDFTSILRTALYVSSADNALDNDISVPSSHAEQFNAGVDKILATKEVEIYISDVFDLGKDVRQLFRAFIPAAARLSALEPLLSLSHVKSSIEKEATSAKFQVLSSISLLELCLVIAMKSLVQGGSSKYNFEMVYNEYKTFMSRHLMAVAVGGAMKVYKKPVALKAFETLVEMELVRPVATSLAAESTSGGGTLGRNDLLAGTSQGTRAPKEYRMVQLMLEPGQVVELVSDRIDVPAIIRRWSQQ